MSNPTGDGKVLVYEVSNEHPRGHLLARVHGETHKTGGRLGSGLHLHSEGSTIRLIVGAQEHDAPDGVDQGGVYPFVFTLP